MINFKRKAKEPALGDDLFQLAHTIDRFERYQRPHANRVARFSEMLASRIGITGADLNAIKLAALLHDVGELTEDMGFIGISGNLDFRQRIDLWRHPVAGEQHLDKRGLPRSVQLLVRWHHEWWNGFGYPDMLEGEAIPIGARILRLVDTYDALNASRPYRPAYSEERSIEIIAAQAGIEFDPFLVKEFFAMLGEMAAYNQSQATPQAAPQTVIEGAVSDANLVPTTEMTGDTSSADTTEVSALPTELSETVPTEDINNAPSVDNAVSETEYTEPVGVLELHSPPEVVSEWAKHLKLDSADANEIVSNKEMSAATVPQEVVDKEVAHNEAVNHDLAVNEVATRDLPDSNIELGNKDIETEKEEREDASNT